MPRWYINPVVTAPGGARRPKVATYTFQDGTDVEGDPIIRPWFSHASIIGSGLGEGRDDLAISLVKPRPGADFSLLDADPECVELFAEVRGRIGREWDNTDRHTWYANSCRELGLNTPQQRAIRDRVGAEGGLTNNLNLDADLEQYVQNLADLVDAGLNPRAVWVF